MDRNPSLRGRTLQADEDLPLPRLDSDFENFRPRMESADGLLSVGRRGEQRLQFFPRGIMLESEHQIAVPYSPPPPYDNIFPDNDGASAYGETLVFREDSSSSSSLEDSNENESRPSESKSRSCVSRKTLKIQKRSQLTAQALQMFKAMTSGTHGKQ